jgi:hypothetical protein
MQKYTTVADEGSDTQKIAKTDAIIVVVPHKHLGQMDMLVVLTTWSTGFTMCSTTTLCVAGTSFSYRSTSMERNI